MNIPWRVLTTVVGVDLQVYAALTTVARATADTVAELCWLSPEAALQSLERLCSKGFVHRRTSPEVPEGSYIHFSVYRNPRIKRSNSFKEREKTVRAPARVEATYDLRAYGRPSAVRSRQEAIQVYEDELSSNTFSTAGVLGCFYVLYKKHTSLDYRGRSFQEELREAELLAYTASDVAIWCVRAFFSPHLEWVKNKSLTFLSNASNVHRFVLGVAMELRAQEVKRPEWKREAPTPCGVLHRPNR